MTITFIISVVSIATILAIPLFLVIAVGIHQVVTSKQVEKE